MRTSVTWRLEDGPTYKMYKYHRVKVCKGPAAMHAFVDRSSAAAHLATVRTCGYHWRRGMQGIAGSERD